MQLLNFLYYKQINTDSTHEVINILPRTNFDENFEKRGGVYKKLDHKEYRKKFHLLWSNIQNWVANNFPGIDPRAVKYCTSHLASHFSINYESIRAITDKLCENLDREVGIICDEEMLLVESDWCSSLVSLIAVIDSLDANGIKYVLIGTDESVVQKLLKFEEAAYLPFTELSKSASPSVNYLINAISSADEYHYGLTSRFRFVTSSNYVSFIPKSLVNDYDRIGIYHQFSESQPDIKFFESWSNFSVSTSEFSKKIEINYFDFIGKCIIAKINQAESYLSNTISNKLHFKKFFIEEIIDLEGMALLSLLAKLGAEICLTQHSSNPLTEYALPPENEKSFIRTIYTNSNFSLNKYAFEFKNLNVKVARNPTTDQHLSNQYYCTKSHKVIIIENDFFRRFGCSVNLNNIISDIITYIAIISSAFPACHIIWRQRTGDFQSVFQFIKGIFPKLNIEFSAGIPREELYADCNVSVGFGYSSSLSLELIDKGLVNLFGSSELDSDFEYVPLIKNLHHRHGPLYSAHTTQAIWKSKITYEDIINEQQSFLKNM